MVLVMATLVQMVLVTITLVHDTSHSNTSQECTSQDNHSIKRHWALVTDQTLHSSIYGAELGRGSRLAFQTR